MAGNKKNIYISYPQVGKTIYCMVMKENYGNQGITYYDNTDGDFRAVSVSPYLPLTEDSIIKGLYGSAENRTSWERAEYTFQFFIQGGVSPSPASDEIITVDSMKKIIEFDKLEG